MSPHLRLLFPGADALGTETRAGAKQSARQRQANFSRQLLSLPAGSSADLFPARPPYTHAQHPGLPPGGPEVWLRAAASPRPGAERITRPGRCLQILSLTPARPLPAFYRPQTPMEAHCVPSAPARPRRKANPPGGPEPHLPSPGEEPQAPTALRKGRAQAWVTSAARPPSRDEERGPRAGGGSPEPAPPSGARPAATFPLTLGVFEGGAD